jgi:hypothetical protein
MMVLESMISPLCVTVPFKKAVKMALSGEIMDSKTIIGLLACAVGKI